MVSLLSNSTYAAAYSIAKKTAVGSALGRHVLDAEPWVPYLGLLHLLTWLVPCRPTTVDSQSGTASDTYTAQQLDDLARHLYKDLSAKGVQLRYGPFARLCPGWARVASVWRDAQPVQGF